MNSIRNKEEIAAPVRRTARAHQYAGLEFPSYCTNILQSSRKFPGIPGITWGLDGIDGMPSSQFTLRKLVFYFLSNIWMGYDRGDSFPFDFEPNAIPFSSENRKENCHNWSWRFFCILKPWNIDSVWPPWNYFASLAPPEIYCHPSPGRCTFSILIKNKRKLSPRLYPIQFERKRNHTFFQSTAAPGCFFL